VGDALVESEIEREREREREKEREREIQGHKWMRGVEGR